MHHIYCGIFVLFSLLTAETSEAFDVAIEFSATAVQIAPGQPEHQKQMYIGKDYVRTDSMFNNTTLIEIFDRKKQLRYFLIPEEKIYLQQENPGPVMPELSEEVASTKPCAGMKDTSCEMLGTEMINNRKTEKWEFTVKQGSNMQLSLHWIDVEHRMLVREFMPDGTLTELLPLGPERINGRPTEKWLWRSINPDGQIETATQWYDLELEIAIREEIPGGYIRELRDIRIGMQEDVLFEIPDEYTQVDKLQDYALPQQSMMSTEQQ